MKATKCQQRLVKACGMLAGAPRCEALHPEGRLLQPNPKHGVSSQIVSVFGSSSVCLGEQSVLQAPTSVLPVVYECISG